MRKIILIATFILLLMTLSGCRQESSTGRVIDTAIQQEKLSADKVDIIPDISVAECLTAIKQTNPEMSDQDAKDNCYIIEAVNKADKSLCNKVSAGFKSDCLAQFE